VAPTYCCPGFLATDGVGLGSGVGNWGIGFGVTVPTDGAGLGAGCAITGFTDLGAGVG